MSLYGRHSMGCEHMGWMVLSEHGLNLVQAFNAGENWPNDLLHLIRMLRERLHVTD